MFIIIARPGLKEKKVPLIKVYLRDWFFYLNTHSIKKCQTDKPHSEAVAERLKGRVFSFLFSEVNQVTRDCWASLKIVL